MKPAEMQKAISRILDEIKGGYADLKSIKGIKGAFKIAPEIVSRVKAIGDEYKLLGPDKKKIAVEIIMVLIPDSWFPDFILRRIVAWAVERAYKAYKKKLA